MVPEVLNSGTKIPISIYIPQQLHKFHPLLPAPKATMKILV